MSSTEFLDLVIKAETEGLDSEDEFRDYVRGLITSGLVNSTGSNQRFVRNAVESYGIEFFFTEEELAHARNR